MKKIIAIIGTRPEAIKMAPIIIEAKRKGIAVITVASGQHQDLVASTLKAFNLTIDLACKVMTTNQGLGELTGKLFLALNEILLSEKPDLILCQGDTTTVFVTGVLGFYHKIPVGHVEAGLRSEDINSPFPEEFNRKSVSLTARLHFAPTELAKNKLLAEGVAAESIFVTGNSVIDALLEVTSRDLLLPFEIPKNKRIILLTAHRRENFGQPHRNIFRAVKKLCSLFSDIVFIYPLHPNPNVRAVAQEELGNIDQVILTEPLPYDLLAALLKRSYLVMTDSGGIQEEAPALSKPVLVLRTETERPEIISAGAAILVGTSEEKVFSEATKLLSDEKYYKKFQIGFSPVGDGLASKRIVKAIDDFLK